MLTPFIIKALKDKMVYIQVTAPGNADYYFSSSLNDKNYLDVSKDIAYYNQLMPNQIINYYFSDLLYVT